MSCAREESPVRWLVPYRRLFPVWKFGPRYDLLGEYVDDGWSPDWFGTWEFPTEAAAREFLAHRASET
jgi:hypothetical protein